jgi:putative transposase
MESGAQTDGKRRHVALGIRPDGTKEVLGLWIEQSEGAEFCPRLTRG